MDVRRKLNFEEDGSVTMSEMATTPECSGALPETTSIISTPLMTQTTGEPTKKKRSRPMESLFKKNITIYVNKVWGKPRAIMHTKELEQFDYFNPIPGHRFTTKCKYQDCAGCQFNTWKRELETMNRWDKMNAIPLLEKMGINTTLVDQEPVRQAVKIVRARVMMMISAAAQIQKKAIAQMIGEENEEEFMSRYKSTAALDVMNLRVVLVEVDPKTWTHTKPVGLREHSDFDEQVTRARDKAEQARQGVLNKEQVPLSDLPALWQDLLRRLYCQAPPEKYSPSLVIEWAEDQMFADQVRRQANDINALMW